MDDKYIMSDEEMESFLLEEGDENISEEESELSSPQKTIEQEEKKLDELTELVGPGGVVVATAKEKKFLDDLKRHGNQTRAAMYAFNCKDEKSASAIGARVAKKFKVDSRGNRTRVKVNTATPTDHGRVEAAMRDYKVGVLTVVGLRKILEDIAKHDRNGAAQVNAVKLLWQMHVEAKKLQRVKKMAEEDVVDLLSKCLSKIPKSKYMDVLKECRKMRQELIQRKNDKYPLERVEQITNDARNEYARYGRLEDYKPDKDE